MAGGIQALARLQCKVDANNALVVTVDSGSTGVVVSIIGTAGQVLANGTSVTPQTGAVTLTLAPALTGIDSITFSGGQSIVGTTANVTELYNGASGQMVNLYRTRTSGSVYERLEIGANAGGQGATTFGMIVTQLGGGTARSLNIGTTGSAGMNFITNNVNSWSISTAGHFLAQAGNTYDLGASATPCRTGYFGTSVRSPQFVVSSGAATYTITNVTTDRSYDANATTLDEIADTLGTLVADLRAIGLVL